MRFNCDGTHCVDCPILELQSEEFTDQDRVDGFNSVILLRSQFKEMRDRFDEWEASRLEAEARKVVRYSNEAVSRVAVRALERQVTGNCN
jgi:hypothetical protein